MVKSYPSLTGAIDLLAKELNVLPATGGATEELELPAEDELEDLLINKDSKEITEILETPESTLAELYRSTPPLFRPERQLHRFFIEQPVVADGARPMVVAYHRAQHSLVH